MGDLISYKKSQKNKTLEVKNVEKTPEAAAILNLGAILDLVKSTLLNAT